MGASKRLFEQMREQEIQQEKNVLTERELEIKLSTKNNENGTGTRKGKDRSGNH